MESINNDAREYVLFADQLDTTLMSSSDLARATKADSTLKQVAVYIRDGWPRKLPRSNPDILSTPEPLAMWETLFGTGTTGQVTGGRLALYRPPEGHRMATIKAADGEHHRRHYDQLRARRTDSAELATGEAEVKQEAGVEAPQTEAGENGAPETSREGPQSPGAPDADSRPNMDDNQVGNDVSGAQSDSNNKESDPGETVLRRSTRNRRPPDRYQP
ncbi:hypothetical protein MTO96_050057 [Rhipicephalus appendiculatus]